MRAIRLCTLAALMVVGASIPATAECISLPGGSCSLIQSRPIIFVGTPVMETDLGWRFRIEENFRGTTGGSIEIMHMPVIEGGAGFSGLHKRYLVFAMTMEMDGVVRPYVGGCGHQLVDLTDGSALLEQLRREKAGKPVASVYGQLIRTQKPEAGIWDESYTRPLAGVPVKLQGEDATLETTTTGDGTYQFERVRSGRYLISANLPQGLELAELFGDDPVPALKVERGSCYELDIYAMPTTTISGRVFGPDGRPLAATSVSLIRRDEYKEGARGAFGFQGAPKPFEYRRLPPGDYILFFGSHPSANWMDPDNPFPLTFHPDAADIVRARIIHLGDGEQIRNADIHLPAAVPTRTLVVTLDWNGRNPADYYNPQVIAETQGRPPGARKLADDTYSVNLFPAATYRLRAQVICRSASGTIASNHVAVEGRDAAIGRITLTLPPGECKPK